MEVGCAGWGWVIPLQRAQESDGLWRAAGFNKLSCLEVWISAETVEKPFSIVNA